MQPSFDAYLMATYLTVQCHDRDNNTDKAANRSNYRAISQDTLASFLTDKATIVNERLSFVCYLKIVCMLFKKFFLSKKRDGFYPTIKALFIFE